MIVKKAYHMAEMMHIPILGVVENFSYLKCPDCGTMIHLFGESKINEVAASLGIPVLGKLPIDPESAKAADAGNFHEIVVPELAEGVKAIEEM